LHLIEQLISFSLDFSSMTTSWGNLYSNQHIGFKSKRYCPGFLIYSLARN